MWDVKPPHLRVLQKKLQNLTHTKNKTDFLMGLMHFMTSAIGKFFYMKMPHLFSYCTARFHCHTLKQIQLLCCLVEACLDDQLCVWALSCVVMQCLPFFTFGWWGGSGLVPFSLFPFKSLCSAPQLNGGLKTG